MFNLDGGATGGFTVSGVDKNGNPITVSAIFLFATEDGAIVGWNPAVNPKGFDPPKAGTYGIIAVDNSGTETGTTRSAAEVIWFTVGEEASRAPRPLRERRLRSGLRRRSLRSGLPYWGRTGTRARRKPRLKYRLPGAHLLRSAAQQFQAMSLQLPPRSTREEPP